MNAVHWTAGRRTVWAGFRLILALAIGLALFRYLGALLFAIFLYYATRPLYRHLDRYVDHPNVTATLTLFVIVLPMVAVIGYTVMVALNELDQVLASSDLGTYRSALDPFLSLSREGVAVELEEALSSGSGGLLTTAFQRGLPTVLDRLSSAAGLVFAILARFFLMVTFLFYLLRDDGKLRAWFSRSVDGDEELLSFLDTVDSDLETIFVGNLAVVGVAAVLAAVTYVGLNLLAPGGPVVGAPVLLAMLIGIGTLIPAVGMKIVYVPYGLYLLGVALTTPMPLWYPLAFFVLSFTVIDTIPDFFARSLLSARSGVHLGLVLIGYFLGTLAFGWYGLFLGPILVVFAVHYAHLIFPDIASGLLSTDDYRQAKP